MFYKNVSTSVKTFHGVTFNPGDVKEVKKYINDKWMILTDEKNKEPEIQQKPSSEKIKKEVSRDKEQKPEIVDNTPKDAELPENKEQKDGVKQEHKK